MSLEVALSETKKAITACLSLEFGEAYAQAVEKVAETLRSGGTVYFIGNGGSAADAQHLAAELVGRMRFDRAPLRAIALTTDSSILTALVNDYDPRLLFARQVEALMRPGDILVAISTSGASANVIEAAVQARRKGAQVVSFTRAGFTELARVSDVVLGVPACETPILQVVHILVGQAMLEDVEATLGLAP